MSAVETCLLGLLREFWLARKLHRLLDEVQQLTMHAGRSAELAKASVASHSLLARRTLSSGAAARRCLYPALPPKELRQYKVISLRGTHRPDAAASVPQSREMQCVRGLIAHAAGSRMRRQSFAGNEPSAAAAKQQEFETLRPLSVVRAKNGETLPLVSVFQVR